jgi:hypothetical protein
MRYVATIALLTACGSRAVEDPNPVEDLSSVEDLNPVQDPKADCMAMQNVAKQRIADCAGIPPELVEVPYWETFDRFCTGIAAAVARGSIRYDPMDIAQCISDLQAMTCAQVVDDGRLPACYVFHGAVPPGGACYSPFECDGSWCVGECPGTCTKVPVVGVGESCQLAECASGLACVGPTASAVCEPIVAAGARCLDASGKQIAACAPPTVCVGPTCQLLMPKQLGQPCTSRYDCDAFLACITGVCAPSKRIGDACTPGNDECAYYVGTQLYCSADGDGGSDGTCAENPTNGPCRAVTGQPELKQCTDGVCGSTNTCVPNAGEGEPCVAGGVPACRLDWACIGGTCQAYDCY